MRVLVIAWESLAPQRLGCYGNESAQTSAFDQLAACGMLFSSAFALRPCPTPQNLVRDRYEISLITGSPAPSTTSARDRLQAAGVPVRVFEDTLLQAWQRANQESQSDRELLLIAAPSPGTTAAAIHEADDDLDEFLADYLPTAQADDLLIITASAGEVTAPHPAYGPNNFWPIHESVHVPLLILVGTGDTATSSCRRSELVQLPDVAATACAWFDVSTAGFKGIPLLTRTHSRPECARESLFYGHDQTGWGLRTTRHSCLLAPTNAESGVFTSDRECRLFVKPDDPFDVFNIGLESPDLLRELSEQLREQISAKRFLGEIKDQTLR